MLSNLFQFGAKLCSPEQVFQIDKEFTQKSTIIFRTVPFEYGSVDWVFGIKFLYETLLQEERLYLCMYILSNITLQIFMFFQRRVFNLWFCLCSQQHWWLPWIVLWSLTIGPDIYIWIDGWRIFIGGEVMSNVRCVFGPWFYVVVLYGGTYLKCSYPLPYVWNRFCRGSDVINLFSI